MSREGLRILEQRAVPRVGVREQDGVRQVLAQSVGVGNGNHLVVDTVHDERGMPDGPEFGESLALEPFPLAECRYLSARDLRTRDWIEVVFALRDPSDECLTRGLTRGRRCEEDLFQDIVPSVRWILDALRQARFLEMHNVFAASRRRSYQDYPPKDRRSVLHHLQCDHPTEGVPDDVARLYSKFVQKGHRVFRHSGDRLRDVAGGTPHASVVEQDDLPSGGERISHRGIPVVERPGEVLQAEQR